MQGARSAIAWLVHGERTETPRLPSSQTSLLPFLAAAAARTASGDWFLVPGEVVIACCWPALNRDALTHPLHAAATFCNQQQQIVGE